MSSLNLNAKQINSEVTKKLKLKNVRSTRENHGDFFLDGEFQFTATMPNVHGSGGTPSPLFLKNCRDSVFLNARQYANLVRCPLTAEEYEELIRQKFNIPK